MQTPLPIPLVRHVTLATSARPTLLALARPAQLVLQTSTVFQHLAVALARLVRMCLRARLALAHCILVLMAPLTLIPILPRLASLVLQALIPIQALLALALFAHLGLLISTSPQPHLVLVALRERIHLVTPHCAETALRALSIATMIRRPNVLLATHPFNINPSLVQLPAV